MQSSAPRIGAAENVDGRRRGGETFVGHIERFRARDPRDAVPTVTSLVAGVIDSSSSRQRSSPSCVCVVADVASRPGDADRTASFIQPLSISSALSESSPVQPRVVRARPALRPARLMNRPPLHLALMANAHNCAKMLRFSFRNSFADNFSLKLRLLYHGQASTGSLRAPSSRFYQTQ